VNGSTARIIAKCSALELTIQEPANAVFQAIHLKEECRINQRKGVLTRLSIALPTGTLRFHVQIVPKPA